MLSHSQPSHDFFAPALNHAEFADAVKEVLDHLYDSPYLQKHRLAELLVDGRLDPRARSQELRRICLNAIQAMRPAPGTPAQSPDWRAYHILELRYLEGLTPRQTMDQVALAKSQFYREQARILDLLIDHLWTHYAAQAQHPLPSANAPEQSDQPAPPVAPGLQRIDLVQEEVARLCAHADWQTINIGEILAELRQVVEGVAVAQAVSLRITSVGELRAPRADRVLLRQAILNVITYGLDLAWGGQLLVTPLQQQNVIGLRVLAQPPPLTAAEAEARPAPKPRQGIGLLISRQLMPAMGGELVLPANKAERSAAGGEPWEALLLWPTDATPVLLVIDDNEALLRLFQRYLAGYEWHVIGVTDGGRAWRTLAEVRPTVIILDVMMPKEDGWALLQRLQTTPTTNSLPVVICSVLNEPQLAQSLGAAAYLPKPVSQRALLQLLARWQPGVATPRPTHPASPSATESLRPTHDRQDAEFAPARPHASWPDLDHGRRSE